jgi:iron(II)-dependent oxidoreductase
VRLTFDDFGGPAVTVRDPSGAALSAPEPLIHWTERSNLRSRKEADAGWLVELGPPGLTAQVSPPRTGEYGEFLFEIRLRNTGRDVLTGSLLPPFARWAESDEEVSRASAEHILLTANRVVLGTLGRHRSWSAGSEFESDVFASVPALHAKRYLAAVLLADPGEVEHRRDVITLKPGQTCRYRLHIDSGPRTRNEALHETYRSRGGYRVHPAAYSLAHYNDPDLSWAKNTVATWLDWAWDKDNLDPREGGYRLVDSLERARRRFGGYDAFVLWPFWPRAGFDARFQMDHYRDLPGGVDGLRREIEKMRSIGVRTFISYCHWSESDRDKGPAAMAQSYREFAELACRVGADGALMDLMSKTPDEILRIARECGRKLVPYNEGDPTWSDTQTNLLGRIHNDLPMPEFNLKKYMLPHHPQLRVCEPGNTGKRMRNDFVLSFFNGHGVEINTMFPQSNPATDADWPVLARALDLLRTNRANFTSPHWSPLIASEDASVWINRWPAEDSTLYSICATSPAGHHGPLLTVPHRERVHYVDMWRYRQLTPERRGDSDVISYDVEGYTPGLGSLTGSADYSPGCIGAFRQRMRAWLDFEMLHVELEQALKGGRVEIRLGTVEPQTNPVRMPAAKQIELDLFRQFGRHTNETVIVRLVDRDGQVQDVAIVPEDAVRFFRVDKLVRTAPVEAATMPDGMVRIPGGQFRYVLTNPAPPAEFPFAEPPFQPTYAYLPGAPPVDRQVTLQPFWMDRYPVTNAQYAAFVAATSYRPKDATNFLRHFVSGKPPRGQENHPVVYVSYDDAKAYAAWAGKRLPTEEEWQMAAGAADARAWPWGAGWDASRTNPGGKDTEPVGAHPSGASPYGVEDLVGNVWQWTASLMDNGRHLTLMLRGGSWYRPPKGRWWVPGGPRRITENYPLPLAGPAMNRLATVGFRCVKDEASR